MRFVKIFFTIVFIILSFSVWLHYQYKIAYFFGNPSKEKITYLKKEAKENNLTAASDLVSFYIDQRNFKMFKKYRCKYFRIQYNSEINKTKKDALEKELKGNICNK